jgi:hypothetical protein
MTVIETNVAGVTVTVVELETPLTSAVTSVLPVEAPVTNPLLPGVLPTVAMLLAEEDQLAN